MLARQGKYFFFSRLCYLSGVGSPWPIRWRGLPRSQGSDNATLNRAWRQGLFGVLARLRGGLHPLQRRIMLVVASDLRAAGQS